MKNIHNLAEQMILVNGLYGIYIPGLTTLATILYASTWLYPTVQPTLMFEYKDR